MTGTLSDGGAEQRQDVVGAVAGRAVAVAPAVVARQQPVECLITSSSEPAPSSMITTPAVAWGTNTVEEPVAARRRASGSEPRDRRGGQVR